MLRPAVMIVPLATGLTLGASLTLAAALALGASLALAGPAAADGFPNGDPGAPAGDSRPPAGYETGRRPATRPVHRGRRLVAAVPRGSALRPVSYGEIEGPVFHAWLPRNTNLPIYNIPPPFFPEP